MSDNFKNLNTITELIKRKIYKKKDTRFIVIMENWQFIVGDVIYEKSSPIKITADQSLMVEVNNDILIDFKFSSEEYLAKINKLLGYNKNINKILVVQKNTINVYILLLWRIYMYIRKLILVFLIVYLSISQAITDSHKNKNENILGDNNAINTLVEYASMSCVHCANFHNNDLLKN